MTPEHPVWSVSRQGWVAAGDLYQGESVATMAGPAMVVGAVPASDRTVYNLEVLGHHTYFVGDDGVWVHNSYVTPGSLTPTHGVNTPSSRFQQVLQSVVRDGVREPIKVVEDMGRRYIVDGHHRREAAIRAGIELVPIERVQLPFRGYRTIEDLFNPW